jgi:PAS domain S-box-containing protein
MEASQRQTSVVLEQMTPNGLPAQTSQSGKLSPPTNGKSVRMSQTGKLRQWLELLDHNALANGPNSIVEGLAFLRPLVESSPDGVFVKDPQGRYLYVNSTFAYWVQRQPEDMIGKTDQELFSLAVAALLSGSDTQVFKDGKAFTEELELDDLTLENSGAERSLLTTKIPFRNQAEQIVGLLGMARDNTLRKLMEDDLREAKQFNEQVIANAREGVIVYDADLRCVVWNSFMEEFSGIPRQRVIGRHPLETFPTIREVGMLQLIEQALAGQTVTSADFQIASLRGAKQAWATCRFGPLHDAKGDVTGVIGMISDITDHKKSEARLRRSQQFNQQVIANASEGIVVYDRDLRCMVWNPIMEELSGLSSEDVLGRQILSLAPQWRDSGLREMLQQVLQGDTVEAPDFQIDPYRDRWISSRYSPLVDKDEQCIGIIGILTEVTGRRQAEEALRESQQFNQQVIDSSPNGIAVYDRDLRVVIWNPAMEGLLEMHCAHVLGQHILDVFPHLADTEAPALWQRALAGETINEREFQFTQRADKWVSASYVPLCNPRGEIVGLIVTVRDITARKQAEEALQASQQFNQQIITNAREGIIVYDNSLRYLLWNPAMETLSGLSAETVIGQHALEINPEAASNGIYLNLQAAVQGETPPRYDYEYRFPMSVKHGFCSRQDAPLLDENGVIVGVISVISEITDRKQAEEELRESKQFSQEIVASAREGFVVYDRDFKIKIWNAAMEELSGLACTEVLGKDIFEVFPPIRETSVPERLAEALEGKTTVGKDFQLPVKNQGKSLWLSARYGPHRNSHGEVVGVIVTIRDVTARRNTEEQLRNSEERYREILATLQDGYWEATLAGELFFFNEAICTIFGRPDAEITWYGYTQFTAKVWLRRARKILRQVRKTKQPVKSFEFEIRHPDGTVRTLETSVSLICLEDGTPGGYRGIARDVTERKQAELKLRERDDRFRALIENSYDGILLLTRKGQTLYVSPSYTRILGYQPEEVLNLPAMGRLHPEDVGVIEGVGKSLAPGASVNIEYRTRHKSGQYRWIEGRVTNLLEEPSVRAFVVNFHDITERKQVEETLRASEQRFRALVENGFDGISLQDADGLITYVSPAYKRILGYEPAEVVGKKPFAQVHPDEIELALQKREEIRKTPGARQTMQFRTQHKNGTWQWLEVTLTNLLEEPSVGAIVVNFRDITEHHQSELALRQSEEKFRAIWDNAMDAMLIVNDDMQYVDANPAACALYGVTREELVRHSMADFVTPEKRQEARRSLTKLIRLGERKGNFNLRRPDHSIHEIEYNARANFLPGLHLSMMRDVTERNRAEEALRASEEHYRSLVSVLEEGVLMLDVGGHLLTCNESAERILGVTRDELHEHGIFNPAWQAIREDGTDFPSEASPVAVTLRTGQACSAVVIGLKRAAGDQRWLSVSSQPVFHQEEDPSAAARPEAGQPQAVVVSISDITERKLAETALRKSEALFATAFDASPVAVSLTELPLGTLVKINQAWSKMFGYAAAEACGKTSFELNTWLEPEARHAFMQKLETEGEVWEYPAQMRARTGELRHALISARKLELDQRQYALTLLLDVTERKQAEEALRVSEERFAAAFNASPDALAITTFEGGRFVMINQAWLSSFGLAKEAVLGQSVLDHAFWVNPEQARYVYETVRQTGALRDYEAQVRLADGELGELLISAETVQLGDERFVLSVSKNITERKRAEEALQRSETRFSKTYNACPEPMALVRVEDGCYVSANQACLTTLGLSAQEILGRTPADIGLWVHQEQYDRFTKLLSAQREVRDFECDYYIKDKRIGHFLVSAELIELDGAAHILAVARDITERNRADEALRASEERFSRAFNSSPQPIVITSLPDGRFIAVNQAWTKTLGYTPEETIGQDGEDLALWLRGSQLRRLRAMVGKLHAVRDLELTLRTKQGETRYLTVAGEVIRLAGETYLLLTGVDVTARKLAELALRDTEQRYRLLFDHNLAGVYRVSVEGQYLDCNEAFATMFGFDSPAEIMAAGPLSLYPDPLCREQLLTDLRKQNRLTDYEMHLQRKDGQEIWGLANLTLLKGENGAPDVFEGIILDITKRKQDEAKLAESREQLRALSARLSAIREEERAAIAREIHDSLGQMLTGLKLDVSWLNKRLNGLHTENAPVLVQKTESMADLLDNTIQTVRDLATQLRPGVLDTLGLTAAIEWQVQDFQARTNIECEVWLCPEPKEMPKEKATALFRILQEILTNIIRHAEATRIVIHLLPADGALLLSVADNGRGITTGNLRDAKSLGLLGMRERALMIGGEVQFEGAPDRGTTVTVKVPL